MQTVPSELGHRSGMHTRAQALVASRSGPKHEHEVEAMLRIVSVRRPSTCLMLQVASVRNGSADCAAIVWTSSHQHQT